MYLKEINHLAFIAGDMEQTIRFYRDLLSMGLTHGIAHDGHRHYFFKTGNNHIALFPMTAPNRWKKVPWLAEHKTTRLQSSLHQRRIERGFSRA